MHFKDISQTFQRNFLSDLFEYECTEDEIQKGLDDLTVTLKNNSNVKEDENSFYFNKKDLTRGISIIRGASSIHCVIIKKKVDKLARVFGPVIFAKIDLGDLQAIAHKYNHLFIVNHMVISGH